MKLFPALLIAMVSGVSQTIQAADTNFFPVLTVKGRSYTNAQIVHPTPTGAGIYFDGGMTSLRWSDAPEALQMQYGYSLRAAQDYEAEQKFKQREQIDKDYMDATARAERQRVQWKIDRLARWDKFAELAQNPISSIYQPTKEANDNRLIIRASLFSAGRYYEELAKTGDTNAAVSFERMKGAFAALVNWQQAYEERIAQERKEKQQRAEDLRIAAERQRALDNINANIARQNRQLAEIRDAQDEQAGQLRDLRVKQQQAEDDKAFNAIRQRFNDSLK